MEWISPAVAAAVKAGTLGKRPSPRAFWRGNNFSKCPLVK